MQTVYNSPYTKIVFDQTMQIQVQVWKNTENFTDELYKKEVSANADTALAHKPKGLVSEATYFEHIVSPTLQTWTTENFFLKIQKAGVKRYGVIIGKELFVQVSVEQTIDEAEGIEGLAIRYFDDLEKAKAWVSQD